MGKISVIIPTYNRKDTILRAIESVLNQSVASYEILVCDDGSTDRTEVLVKEIKDKRIHWIPGSHSGLPAVPRNRGIRDSKGEWIAFLDSDDWWFPKKLESQLVTIRHNNLLAASSNALIMQKQKKIGKILNYRKNIVTFSDLLITNFVVCSSSMIHRSLLQKCKGFPESPSLKAIEDYALWLRIATQTSFGYISEPLVYYNDDTHSVRSSGPKTFREQKDNVFGDFLLWVKHVKFFLQ